MTLLVLRGLPASGKTTFARERMRGDPQWKRVNKDEIRAMLHEGAFDRQKEALTIAAEDELIRLLLRRGFNVIVDDTNLDPKHRDRFRMLAAQLHSEDHLQVTLDETFLDVSVDECLRRNGLRAESVPETVITSMHDRYLA